jgi:phage/plasmid-like protein (TIGR03299 family)
MYDRIIHNPTEDQINELFGFEVHEEPVYTKRGAEIFEIEGQKAMVTSDRNQVLGIHSHGFTGYGYKRLDQDASRIVNGSTVRKGAGLLYDRGVAFVQVGIPESVKSRSGVAFDPFLLGTTSFNGRFKTSWGTGMIVVVCRNTHAMAVKRSNNQIAVKHSKNADTSLQIENVQQALGIITDLSSVQADHIDRLCDVTVTDSQFQQFLDKLVPINSEESLTGRGETIRSNKRDALETLFHSDARCQPSNTAWAVLQATNTFNHHLATQRGASDREVRNMENVVSGKFAENDLGTMQMLSKVLNRELVAV